MKKQIKRVKLELTTQTVRELSTKELNQVDGAGVSAQTYVAGKCQITTQVGG